MMMFQLISTLILIAYDDWIAIIGAMCRYVGE